MADILHFVALTKTFDKNVMETKGDISMNNVPILPHKVLTFPEVAEVAGISLSTLRREINRGEGPTVTTLSTRRKGVRSDHFHQWLNARSSPQADE
jgi:predicted DNA-binding transcriptional regulator AlpA